MAERVREARYQDATSDFCSLLADGVEAGRMGHAAIEEAAHSQS